MKIVQMEEKKINGLITRTKNKDEMIPEKSKIAALWKSFDDKVLVDYKNGNRVFGVYYNYESDANGEFTVLGACPRIAKNPATDKSGQYIFSAS